MSHSVFSQVPAEILQEIVNYLDAFEIAFLDFVVDAMTRYRIRTHVRHHLAWIYEDDGSFPQQRGVPSHHFEGGPSALPKCFVDYSKVEKVTIGTHYMPSFTDLSPSHAMLERWGPNLLKLEIATPHLFHSLLSPSFHSQFPSPSFFSPQQFHERMISALTRRDQLNVMHWTDLSLAPNASQLTNPWLSLETLLPNLHTFAFFAVETLNENAVKMPFAADYLSLLLKSLPKSLRSLSANLDFVTHPILVRALPIGLTSLNQQACVSFSRLLWQDTRTNNRLEKGQLLHLPDLIDLTVEHGTIKGEALDDLSQLTRLNIMRCDPNEGPFTLLKKLKSLEGHLQNICWNSEFVQSLPLTLETIIHRNNFSRELTTSSAAHFPKTITHLSVPSIEYIDADSFSQLPQKLTYLHIGSLSIPTRAVWVSRAPSLHELHQLSMENLDCLPDTLTYLSISMRAWIPVKEAAEDRLTLKRLARKKLLRTLRIPTPFLIDTSLYSILPNIQDLHLSQGAITEDALRKTEGRLSKLRIPTVILASDDISAPISVESTLPLVDASEAKAERTLSVKEQQLFSWIRQSPYTTFEFLKKVLPNPFPWVEYSPTRANMPDQTPSEK